MKNNNLLLVWLLSVSAIFFGCAKFSQIEKHETPNVRVAYAHMIGQPTVLLFGQMEANYHVDHFCAGRPLSNNCIRLLFAKTTMPSDGLATNAILIFHWESFFQTYTDVKQEYGYVEDEYSSHYAFQNDARKGILPDTPANREKVSRWSLEYLSRTPPGQEITEEKAIESATAMLRASSQHVPGETYKFTAKRYAYGWLLRCNVFNADGRQTVGNFCCILVGDDGEIKQVFSGM